MNERKNKWMNERKNERTNKWTNERGNEWRTEWMNERMNDYDWTSEWINNIERITVWMNERMRCEGINVFHLVPCFPVDSMFTQDLDGVFQKMIDTVYKETSMHLLQVLHSKYKFMDHLKVEDYSTS